MFAQPDELLEGTKQKLRALIGSQDPTKSTRPETY